MRHNLIIIALAVICCSCVSGSIQRDPIYRETTVRQARPKLEAERFDPQEKVPSLAHVFLAADMKAERAVANVPRDSDFIFRFWRIKKKLLKREFNVEWRPPAELNPQIEYENYGQPKITDTELATIMPLVAARMVKSDEEIRGARRVFAGVVFVTTHVTASGEWRQYELHGSEKTWSFHRVVELCVFPLHERDPFRRKAANRP